MRNPYKEPWRFYDLDECESQYIFGFRKHPCKGDKIPKELHPERVKKLILGEPPSHTLNDERAKQRWYLEQYHKKLVSKDNMRLDSVSNNSILVSGDRMIFEDVKIHQPIIPT